MWQVKEVIAELLGKQTGAARGLGGSMHLYKREHNFFGGEGIVGTHVREPASSLGSCIIWNGCFCSAMIRHIFFSHSLVLFHT